MYIGEKYEVLEILGKGGSGIVYKVFDTKLQRILAVKESVLKQGELKEEKEREVEVLKSCFHPSLPIVIENFWQENIHYMVMEYMEGVTLKEYVEKQGSLSQEEAIRIGLAIGEILLYLHTRNQPVFHGDLKPQNIMITQEGQVRLIDFGTAGKVDEILPERKGIQATFGYAAPEQLKGKAVDCQSDIYSYGAVLHYLLTGEDTQKPPYMRRKLRECNYALSGGLERVLNRCLKEETEKRYQSMERVLEDLRKYRNKDRVERFFWQVKQVVGTLLFLASAGFFYEAFEKWQLGIALLDNEALFLSGVFGLLAFFWRICILGKIRENTTYHLEKNIWKTQKQGIGLFLSLFCLGILGLGMGASAKSENSVLPVTIYDDAGRKLLVQENTEIPLKGGFRMEIPEECFEVGKPYEITVILSEPMSEKDRVRQFKVLERKEKGQIVY